MALGTVVLVNYSVAILLFDHLFHISIAVDCHGNVSRQLSGSEAKLEELRQRVKVMDDALKANAMSTNAMENAKKNLEAKVKMYEDKLPHLENNLVRLFLALNHSTTVGPICFVLV